MRIGIDGELETLCRSCGLCCDGSLFGCVTLEPDEVRGARKRHLDVLQRAKAFEQPCSALSTVEDGCACSVYSDRPRSCRAFTCRVYDRHRREGGPLEVRLEAVRRVRALLRFLEVTTNEQARRAAVAELTQRMEDDFARACRNSPASRDIQVNPRKELTMKPHRTIVILYSTLDGFMQDPDGRGGTPNGGWIFRYGPEAVAGDKFKLGALMNTGVLVLGRKTWELFAQIWPERTDDFSLAMNRIPKLVATSKLTDLSAYKNSSRIEGDLFNAIEKQKAERDVIITGSASVIHALARQDRVDEYRLIIMPTVLGGGTRVFETDSALSRMRLTSVEQQGAAAYLRFERGGATS
jgi:dihydrofolate reductase/Fe-S-cluster containining protein